MRALLAIAASLGAIQSAWAGDLRTCAGRSVVPAQSAQGPGSASWGGPTSTSGPYHDLFDPLLELSRATDERVRAAAVRSLGPFIGASRVEREIRDILDKDKEAVAVRREALIALWGLYSRVDVRREIVRHAMSKAGPAELRITALKLFSQVACDDADTRSLLHSVLSDGNDEIRMAAAWGLWTDTANPLSRQHLLSIAKDKQNGQSLRVEAVRSLVDGNGIEDWETQRLLLDLAEHKSTDARVREAAVMGLSYLSHDWTVRRSLRTIADDNQSTVSLAAIRAMGGPTIHTSRYFEHIIE